MIFFSLYLSIHISLSLSSQVSVYLSFHLSNFLSIDSYLFHIFRIQLLLIFLDFTQKYHDIYIYNLYLCLSTYISLGYGHLQDPATSYCSSLYTRIPRSKKYQKKVMAIKRIHTIIIFETDLSQTQMMLVKESMESVFKIIEIFLQLFYIFNYLAFLNGAF